MGSLDGNPVVQALGLEHDNAYVKETITFLFTLAMVQSVKAAQSKNIVQQIGTACIRCYGGVGFVLPLALGQLPGAVMSNMDLNVYTVVAAMLFSFFMAQFVPGEVAGYVAKMQDVSVSIVRANAAGAGYELGKATFTGSTVAPFACAYLACNGHQLIENGVAAWNSNKLNANEVLAVFGGPVYWAQQAYLQSSPLTSRVGLVIFRSADYVDYDEIFNNVVKSVTNVAGGSSSKRKR